MSTVPKASEQQAADTENDSGGEYFEAPITQEDPHEVSDEHFDTPEVPDSEPTGLGTSRIKPKKKPSAISGRKFHKRDLVRIDTLRPSLADRIRSDHPDLPRGARISREELGRYRMKLMAAYLKGDKSGIPAGNLIIIPTKIIGKDDVDAYAANLKAMAGK